MFEHRRRALAKVALVVACMAATIAVTVVNASARTVPVLGDAGTGADCPHAGHLTYTLERAAQPTAEQSSAYREITTAMDRALAVYNCHADLTRSLWVTYDPGVPTADGSENGSIRFGARATMQQVTAMHEISHTLGVGTNAAWSRHLLDGRWTGPAAAEQLRLLTGDRTVYGDRQHFWPYGLNQVSEARSPADLEAHVLMVLALRRDMGL